MNLVKRGCMWSAPIVNLIADEKHSWLLRERIYIPTTVAAGCILEVDVVASADTQALLKGYALFRAEANTLNPDWKPETVNTDTQNSNLTQPSTLSHQEPVNDFPLDQGCENMWFSRGIY